jgi:hypothetical protein
LKCLWLYRSDVEARIFGMRAIGGKRSVKRKSFVLAPAKAGIKRCLLPTAVFGINVSA